MLPQDFYVASVRPVVLNQGGKPVPENQRERECLVVVTLLVGENVQHPLQVVDSPSPRGENQAEPFAHAGKDDRLSVILILPARHDVSAAESTEGVEKHEYRAAPEFEADEIRPVIDARNRYERAFREERVGKFL